MVHFKFFRQNVVYRGRARYSSLRCSFRHILSGIFLSNNTWKLHVLPAVTSVEHKFCGKFCCFIRCACATLSHFPVHDTSLSHTVFVRTAALTRQPAPHHSSYSRTACLRVLALGGVALVSITNNEGLFLIVPSHACYMPHPSHTP